MELDLTTCPECALPAEVLHRSVLQSTEGPVEHVKLQCIVGHWFFMEARRRGPRSRSPRAL